MKFILKFVIRALIILVICRFLPGSNVDDIQSALLLAVVLGLLNTFLKPLLVVFTIPITFLTLGLFLLVINGIIVLVADYFIDGFHVNNFLIALLFSIILSIASGIIEKMIGDKKKKD
jgi:putative membrane protein